MVPVNEQDTVLFCVILDRSMRHFIVKSDC